MSNEQVPESSPTPSAPASSDSSPMRVVLFAVLAVLVVAFAYDFLWARAHQSGAANRLRKAMQGPSAEGKAITKAEPITYETVLELVGCKPVEEIEHPTCFVERFSWRAGLPWKTHDLYIVCTKTKATGADAKPQFLYDLSVGRPPEAFQFPTSTSKLNAKSPGGTTLAKPGDAKAAGTKGQDQKPAAAGSTTPAKSGK